MFEQSRATHDLSFVAGQTTEDGVLVEYGSRPREVPARRTTATFTSMVSIVDVTELVFDLLYLS